ncbi:hypothetical protein CR513_15821, partial [Mucuna pruriens]
MPQQDKSILLPLTTRTLSARNPETDEELPRMFWKVEINIPLLDAIKHIPNYAKFLKELCVHKRKKMKIGMELGGIVSVLTRNKDFTVGAQRALPKKCRDPEIFSVPCTIGNCTFVDAMMDLGASINVMPISIYKSLNLLANRNVVQPLGVLEDVLVQVNELIFPTDFLLYMEDGTSAKGSTLILGRPFLMTSRTKIDVYVGTLSMEFGDTLVQFNVFEAMKHPTKDHSLFGIDLIEELSNPKSTNDTSSSPPPPIEWKPLENKFLHILIQHKKEIGWKLSDLPRINPSICMHRILMEEEARPIRQQQRRLNPTILDVVKKEVIKNQHDELVPMRIQNSWRIHIAPEDQHKTTFTYPFGTFVYTCMFFGLCNASSTF